MTCNLNGGNIYKGSIAEITVPMFSRCYEGPADDLVVNFYTSTGTSIEFSVSAGTITMDGVNGTVVFDVPQLGVLDDGLLRYHTECGDYYSADWESRWFVVTPNDFTPVEYITPENVDEVVATAMTGYLTITAAQETYATKQEIPEVSGFTTTGQVESMITAATVNFVTSAQVQTTLEDYAKLTDIPSLDGYATQSYVTAATQSMVTSSTINTIWVGTEEQYNAIQNKLNTTLYIIK